MDDLINSIINAGPPVALLIACNAIGWILSKLPGIPNWTIPMVLPIVGALSYPFIGEYSAAVKAARLPWLLMGMYGLGIGAASVGANQALRQFLGRKEDVLPPAPQNPGQAGTASLLLLAAIPLLFAGCSTPDATAYKTAATIEITVDKAMTAWGDYVQSERARGIDTAPQEDKVRSIYSTYRSTMNLVYEGRSLATAAEMKDRIDSARAIGQGLLQLINGLLPANKQIP